jgi:pimeloyl-ACP methyl ester carboxylesterase
LAGFTERGELIEGGGAEMPYLTVEDTTLYYEDAGAGAPILFLHGWGTSGRVWGAQVPEFAADHRVVVPDWRGCGRSDRPATGNDIDGVVGDLIGLIGALGLTRPIVVGSSMGGAFATELALRRPDLVGGVVSVDSPGYWPAQGMDLPAIMSAIRDDRAGFVASWVAHWYAPGTSPALIDWTVRQILDSGTFADDQFAQFATYDPRPVLPDLQVRIHYLHGELDAETPVAVAEACAARTPGATVTVIPGAGHLPHQERPAEFNVALRVVLDRMLATV